MLSLLCCLLFALVNVKASGDKTWEWTKSAGGKKLIDDALKNPTAPIDEAGKAFAAIVALDFNSLYYPRTDSFTPKIFPLETYKEITAGTTNLGGTIGLDVNKSTADLRSLAYVANTERTKRCGRLMQSSVAKKAVALAILRFFATSQYTLPNFDLMNKLGPLLLMTCPLDKVYEGAEELLTDYQPLSDLVLMSMPSKDECVSVMNDPELSALLKMPKDALQALMPILKTFAVAYSVSDQSAQKITDESSAVIAETFKHINLSPPVLVKDMPCDKSYPLIRITKILSEKEYSLFPTLFMSAYAEHDDFALLLDFMDAFSTIYENFLVPQPMDIRQSHLARRLLKPENLKTLFARKPAVTDSTSEVAVVQRHRTYVNGVLKSFCPLILHAYTMMATAYPENATVQELLHELEMLRLTRLPAKEPLVVIKPCMTENQYKAFQGNLPSIRPLEENP